MKVVSFVGSPRRRGNSDILTDTFLEGAQTAGADVTKHFLAKLDINQCKGCFKNCMIKPGHICPIFDDDMPMLIEDMLTADLMLFASPLYCATYTSIMARFFERCLPLLEVEVIGKPGTKEGTSLMHNPVKGKNAVVALVQDLVYPQVGELAFKVYDQVVGRTYSMNILEKIQVVDVRNRGDVKEKTDRLQEIMALGKRLATAP